jgi:hypothetical protein
VIFVKVLTFIFLLSGMASRTEKKREIEILLGDQNVQTIFLIGEAEVWKTWIALQLNEESTSY